MEKRGQSHFYDNNFIVFGHRGVPNLLPENTMESFMKAIELNFTGIELDVVETKDQKLIIHHDLFMKTRDGSKNIRDIYHRELVKQKPRTPSLKQVLSSIGHKTNINIEIKHQKDREDSVVKETIRQLKKYSLIDNIVISSFNSRIIKKIKEEDDRFATALIIGKTSFWRDLLATKLWKNLKIDAIHINHKITSPKIIKKARRINLKVLCYTVNDKKTFVKIKKLGVDGIFTDNPEILHVSRD